MILCGLICTLPMLVFTKPMLYYLGCTESVMPYALEYAKIISLSFIFSILGTSGTFIIRADGAPRYSLWVVVTGSVVNIILDALFMLVFGWGIKGAAWATLIAQVISTAMVVYYMLKKFSAFSLSPADFKPDFRNYRKMAAIGAGPAVNFGTQAIVQVFLNNALKKYGDLSVYGSDMCLAVAGIANKVNTLANAVITGMTNGMQPIVSFNFGKKNYMRVAEVSKKVITVILAISVVIFAAYQIFPTQITSIFGEGDALYYEFAGRYFRIFYMFIILYGLQSSVAGFFSAQGKVGKSIAISLVRQLLVFPPMLIILPRIMGIDGVLWSGPIADLAMAVTACILFVREIKILNRM